MKAQTGKRFSYIAVLFLIVCSLPSCANRRTDYTQQQQIYAQYAGKIELAAEIHKEAMIALGRSYGQGLISSQNFKLAREYGKLVELALRESREILTLYLEGKSQRQVLLTVMGNLDLKLADLFEILDRLGVYGKEAHL